MLTKIPELGEIRKGWQLGYSSRLNKHIWVACVDCGKQRWVALRGGQPKTQRCPICAGRQINLGKRGAIIARWKGGRYTSTQGYIYVLLRPDDFFFPMTKKSGYIAEHRLVMARYLGRNLHTWELVHHINHIRDDNRIENLRLISNERHSQITILENKISSLEIKIEDLTKEIRLLQWQLRERSLT